MGLDSWLFDHEYSFANSFPGMIADLVPQTAFVIAEYSNPDQPKRRPYFLKIVSPHCSLPPYVKDRRYGEFFLVPVVTSIVILQSVRINLLQ
ncbi:MAG: hypothetical protein K0R67_31 [Paenibacillus sp.]|nr:hypothetical protein [Paenibacillus sp.]